MNLDQFYPGQNEKPLDHLVPGGGMSCILRTIGCVGDSLASGEFESLDENGKKGYHDYFEYSWGQFMAREIGSKVYNFSRGGMTAREYCESFADSMDFWNLDKRCQAYILALGVNDISRALNPEDSLGLGELTDVDVKDYHNNKPSFIGCYAQIIQRYQEIQPKAKFFLMTIPRADGCDEARNALQDRHAKLLYGLADLLENCYVMDFRKYSPIHDDQFRKAFLLGGHLNAAGYLLSARMVTSYLDYIIRHNMDDFKQIGFVGTPYHNASEPW